MFCWPLTLTLLKYIYCVVGADNVKQPCNSKLRGLGVGLVGSAQFIKSCKLNTDIGKTTIFTS